MIEFEVANNGGFGTLGFVEAQWGTNSRAAREFESNAKLRKQLINEDPAQAARHLISANPRSVPADAFEEWAKVDPPGFSEFIGSELPAGVVRDAAIVELVDRVRGYDGEAAFAWIDRIGSQKARDDLTQRLEGEELFKNYGQPISLP